MKEYNFHPVHQEFVKNHVLPIVNPAEDMIVIDYFSPILTKPTFWQKYMPFLHGALAVVLLSGAYHHRHRFL